MTTSPSCPDCGAPWDSTSDRCPACGLKGEDVETAAAWLEEELQARTHRLARDLAASHGMTEDEATQRLTDTLRRENEHNRRQSPQRPD